MLVVPATATRFMLIDAADDRSALTEETVIQLLIALTIWLTVGLMTAT